MSFISKHGHYNRGEEQIRKDFQFDKFTYMFIMHHHDHCVNNASKEHHSLVCLNSSSKSSNVNQGKNR